jgi:hypothetical protein
MSAEREYSDIIEDVKKTYEDRAMAMLAEIKGLCERAGMRVDGPHDMGTDTYEWALEICRPGRDAEDVGITLEIVEERDHEGGDGYGVSFRLDVVKYGGIVLGGYQPHNYTPEVWVDARDAAAVAARWQEFAGVDITEIPAVILDGE